MSGFKKHKIGHMSASMLNAFGTNLRLALLRYLCGFREDAGPAPSRGLAVEGGMEYVLSGKKDQATDVALAAFDASMMGEISEEIKRERDAIPGMIAEIAKWAPPAKLLAKQVKIEHWFDEFPIPLVGYIDFVFEDGSFIDLKTTHRCPSEGKPDHIRQIALYSAARQDAVGGLLYVTSKKHAFYPLTVEQRQAGLRGLLSIARYVDAYLLAFDNPVDALKAAPPADDHFFWSDASRAKVEELIGGH